MTQARVAPAGLASQLDADARAVVVRTPAGSAALVRPGAHIDLIAALATSGNEPATMTKADVIAENVLVLAVGPKGLIGADPAQDASAAATESGLLSGGAGLVGTSSEEVFLVVSVSAQTARDLAAADTTRSLTVALRRAQ